MYIARNPSPSSEANDFLRPGSVLGFDQRDTLIVGRIARDSVEYYVLYMAYVAAASLMYTVRVLNLTREPSTSCRCPPGTRSWPGAASA